MLGWRLIIGSVLVAALAGLVWAETHVQPAGAVMFPVMLALAAAAAGELLSMWSGRQDCPAVWQVQLGVLATVAATGLELFGLADRWGWKLGLAAWPALGLTLGLLTAAVGQLVAYHGAGQSTQRLALAIFAMAYVGLPLAWMIALRSVEGPRWGMVALLSMIATVKLADSGAYFTGRLFGRRKLVPRLSPGKTWEGLLGGVLFAILGAAVSLEALPRILGLEVSTVAVSEKWIRWIIYGILLTIAGLVGDLTESLIKRDAGRKDSSTWLPGMGGILDILDSLLLAAPVAYLCWVTGIVGP